MPKPLDEKTFKITIQLPLSLVNYLDQMTVTLREKTEQRISRKEMLVAMLEYAMEFCPIEKLRDDILVNRLMGNNGAGILDEILRDEDNQ